MIIVSGVRTHYDVAVEHVSNFTKKIIIKMYTINSWKWFINKTLLTQQAKKTTKNLLARKNKIVNETTTVKYMRYRYTCKKISSWYFKCSCSTLENLLWVKWIFWRYFSASYWITFDLKTLILQYRRM